MDAHFCVHMGMYESIHTCTCIFMYVYFQCVFSTLHIFLSSTGAQAFLIVKLAMNATQLAFL